MADHFLRSNPVANFVTEVSHSLMIIGRNPDSNAAAEAAIKSVDSFVVVQPPFRIGAGGGRENESDPALSPFLGAASESAVTNSIFPPI